MPGTCFQRSRLAAHRFCYWLPVIPQAKLFLRDLWFYLFQEIIVFQGVHLFKQFIHLFHVVPEPFGEKVFPVKVVLLNHLKYCS
jgi:hypothetical protein